MAASDDRDAIFRLRHDVYAAELGQHPVNKSGILTDQIDQWNVFITAWDSDELAGFISVTPPGNPRYSFDKYVDRADCPFEVDGRLHEIRLLAVPENRRGSLLCGMLMWAAFRWVEAHGGTHVVVVGRREVLPLYFKAGLRMQGKPIRCGAVDFELLHTEVAEIGRRGRSDFAAMLRKVKSRVNWRLDFPFDRAVKCLHGGQVYDAIRPFDSIDKLDSVIAADVLDAWFPPSPGVVAALAADPGLMARTSPPTDSAALEAEVAAARKVPIESIMSGAGSSALIYLAMREWLNPQSRVVLVDPTYGEYRHVADHVVRCHVEAVPLLPDYQLDLDGLSAAIDRGCDLLVLVNPNNPTGRHIPRGQLVSWLSTLRNEVRVWIDEAYVEYAGSGQSMERFAADRCNVVVCKSMSKVYALSGLRVAYLCGPPELLVPLRSLTPPWSISMPAHLAAIHALRDLEYYQGRYRETAALREDLIAGLVAIGIQPVCPSSINAVLCILPTGCPDADSVVETCRSHGVLLRAGSSISARLNARTLRVAVKDRDSNCRIIDTLSRALHSGAGIERTNLAT